MPPRDEITEAVAGYYAGRLAEHGPTHWGVDWNSDESQQLRFEQLLTVAGEQLAGRSIIDWGCGYGGLLTWLESRGTTVDYQGFDVAPEMVASAEEQCEGIPGARFTADAAALVPADLVVASGVFNVRLDTADDAWLEHVRDTLHRMWALARHGISFNMLTSWSDADKMRDYLYYASPSGMFDICRGELSRHVALLHDYGLWEFTVVVRRDDDPYLETPTAGGPAA